MLTFCSCLQESPRDGPEGLEEAEGQDSALCGINHLKAADLGLASLKLLTTISTELPKRPKCEILGVQEKFCIFLLNPQEV